MHVEEKSYKKILIINIIKIETSHLHSWNKLKKLMRKGRVVKEMPQNGHKKRKIWTRTITVNKF